MKRPAAAEWIDRLGLQPHPEGGFFAETYRSAEEVGAAALPSRFRGPRRFSTAIFYLLTADSFSALHRIASDEVWHFHAGDPLLVEAIHPEGGLESFLLGADAERVCVFQGVVPAGCWFGASLAPEVMPESYALIGCTVAPGFDFADFELGRRGELLARYPQHRFLIERLTRG
jgi:uncharacterized protein